MPDLPSNPDSNGDSDVGAARVSTAGTLPITPGWVKVSAIVAIGLVLIFVILHLTGNSPGGMGGHAPLLPHWVQQP